jgi:hypothetical protein
LDAAEGFGVSVEVVFKVQRSFSEICVAIARHDFCDNSYCEVALSEAQLKQALAQALEPADRAARDLAAYMMEISRALLGDAA